MLCSNQGQNSKSGSGGVYKHAQKPARHATRSLLQTIMIEAIFSLISAIMNRLMERLLAFFSTVLLCRTPHLWQPPGPLANYIPFFGSVPLFAFRPSHEVLIKISEKYDKVYRLKLGQTTFIVICDHVVLQDTFAKDVVCGRNMPKMMDVMNQRGLIHADGDLWRNQRFFVHQVLRDMGLPPGPHNAVFYEKCSVAIASLIEELKATNGNPTFVDEALCFALVNTFFSMIIGTTFDRSDEQLKAIIYSTHESYRATELISVANFVPSFDKLPENMKILEDINARKGLFNDYMKFIIQDHRDLLDPENPKDLVDAYLMQMFLGKTFFSESQLKAVLGDLFTANVETISATIHWLLLVMVKFPNVQEKIHEQLDKVVPKDSSPVIGDRKKLAYLEATILEGYRFLSILPYGIPHSTTEETTLSGYHIPKNSTVVGLFWKFNRDPRKWTNPNCFDPRNHLNDNDTLIKNYSLMPYSSGRRACMTEVVANDLIFLVVAKLLHAFNVLPAVDRIDLPSFDECQDGFLRVPVPFQLKFVSRHPAGRRRHFSHSHF